MLQRIHTQARGQHQNRNDEYRGEKLLPLSVDDLGDHVQRIVIGIDAKDTEDARDAEQAEHHRTGREEYGQIERKK